MKKLLLTTLLPIFMLINGCKKDEPVAPKPKPKAEFSYIVGKDGQVYFQSLSTDANEYTWTLGDGNSENGTDFIHQYAQNRTFQVGLTAKGLGGTDIIVKNITVNTVRGSLVIYKKFSTRDRDINVYVDGNYRGFINGKKYYTTAPSCGNENSVSDYQLTEGSHKIECKETGLFPYSWSYNATVIGGNCNSSGLTI